MMTTEQQRIAIAEWRGWIEVQPQLLMGVNPDNVSYFNLHKEAPLEDLPNYPFDLNAMRDAEKKLDGVQQREYLRQIYHIAVELEADKAGISTDVLCNEDEMYIVASASAKERSEALCHTLWPERWVV